MPTNANTNPTGEQVTLRGITPRATVVLAVLGFAALAAAFGLGWAKEDGLRHFFHSYLVNYCYFLSISLGALFFVMLHHVTRAGWSVTVRRLAELMAGGVLYLTLLFLPIVVPVLAGNTSLYPWTDRAVVAGNELLAQKAVYLNPGFFAIRCVVYFAVWVLLANYFLKRSLRQDDSREATLTKRMERFSGPGLLLFAATVTFASFDWLMSLDPAWFSTIYGVYYFSGAAVGFLAAIILAIIALQAAGRLTDSINTEHYHDLGKLLFAFVVFWGYIAFSQYMLIWYANIPEETGWYQQRQSGPWVWVTLALLFGHLLIPFFALLPRWVKRNKPALGFWAAWLLVFHWLDVYWLVMPGYSGDAVPLGPIDVACLVGIACLSLAGMLQLAGERSLVPQGDPRLEESLAFENV